MYLAKVNVNSKIFEVYENEFKIKNILNEVYEKLDNSKEYEEETKVDYTDALGNESSYIRKSKYTFVELDRDDNKKIITGKLVRNFNRRTEEIENDKTEVSYTDEAVSIYFYFDVKNELITFNSRQAFGYNQFTNAFNELLNKTIPGYGFEIFLQKDEDVLQEKLKSFKRINKITAVVIPPNSNTKELEELRNGLSYISECQDANATKYKLELSDSNEDRGLNIQAKLIRDVVKAVSSGYGDLTANGVNERDKAIMMKSNKDAAYTNIINEKISKVEYNKESEDFIERFKKSKNK